MNPDQLPWLYLKRVNEWNPWGDMRRWMEPAKPAASKPAEAGPRKKSRPRWFSLD